MNNNNNKIFTNEKELLFCIFLLCSKSMSYRRNDNIEYLPMKWIVQRFQKYSQRSIVRSPLKKEIKKKKKIMKKKPALTLR